MKCACVVLFYFGIVSAATVTVFENGKFFIHNFVLFKKSCDNSLCRYTLLVDLKILVEQKHWHNLPRISFRIKFRSLTSLEQGSASGIDLVLLGVDLSEWVDLVDRGTILSNESIGGQFCSTSQSGVNFVQRVDRWSILSNESIRGRFCLTGLSGVDFVQRVYRGSILSNESILVDFNQ